MADYTPTTDELRRSWRWWRKPEAERRMGWLNDEMLSEAVNPEFDRAIAKVKAEAWDEGKTAAIDAELADRGYGDPHYPDNPYERT